MLTLEFKDEIEEGTKFYDSVDRCRPMSLKFLEPDVELPYMITANLFLHKRGKLLVSSGNYYHGRSVSMSIVKDIFESSPVGILIKMFGQYYVVGKGFIAKKGTPNLIRGWENETLEILFAVTALVGVEIRDVHDLKIYLNRKLYEPEYKRLMTILKPYMSDHRGDILVTKSINAHLIYTFQLPAFNNARSRVEFADLMKELFYRGIYYTAWRKTEDIRIDAEHKLQMEKQKKEKREKELMNKMLNILTEQDMVITEVVQLEEPVSNVHPIQSPELVQEMVDFQPGVVEGVQSQPATPLEGIVMDIPTTIPISPLQQEETPSPLEEVRVQARRFGTSERMRRAMEEYTQGRGESQRREEGILDNIRLESTPTEQRMAPSMEPQQSINLDPTEPFIISPPDEVPEPIPVDMEMPSDSVHVSDEEMARVLSGFSINPNPVRYSTLLHPITGLPVVESTGGEIDPEEIRVYMDTVYRPDAVDENTEIIIVDSQPDEEEQERLHSASEEELDNDPDAYEDAEYVHEPTGTRLGTHDEG